jgi:hypothetical protein
MPLHRSGLLIIRAWLEPGSTRPLRAHLRLSTDIAAGFDREVTLANVDEVSSVVEGWLRDILAPPAAP